MRIRLVAYGIARDILGTRERELEVTEGTLIADLKSQLTSEFSAFEKLNSLAFAVNEEYASDGYVLQDGDEVVIIPPVSGG